MEGPVDVLVLSRCKKGGFVTELSCSIWFPSPEDGIQDALRDFDVEQIDPDDVPGPVLRLLRDRYDNERGRGAVLRYFKTKNRCSGNVEYAIIPTDTKRFGSVFSNAEWLKRREQKWIEIESMSPSQIEQAVSEIVETYLATLLNPDGSFDGVNLAIEVFNWTGLDYEESCRVAAAELIKRYMDGQVRKDTGDRWILVGHKLPGHEEED